MGRQINFYMNKETERRFMEYIIELGFFIIELDDINEKLKYTTKVEDLKLVEDIYIYIYNKEYGELSFFDNDKEYGFSDITSSVIQFSRTIFKEKDKSIIRGRIWYEHKYYADDGSIVEKDIRLLKDYEKLVRWIKKNVPYQMLYRYNCNGQELISKEYVNDDLKEKYEHKYDFDG